MLTIRKEQMDCLEAATEARFINDLKRHLATRHPAFLPRFPEEVQNEILINMVTRSRDFGATWASTIALLCDLMETFSPTLLQQKEIRAITSTQACSFDERIKTIPNRITENQWRAIAGSRQDLSLYVHPRNDQLPLVNRVALGLTLVRWDRCDESSALELAEAGSRDAARLFAEELQDAPLVLSAWRALYGRPPDRELGALRGFSDGIDKRQFEAIALLRMRAMVDHGRRI